MNTTSFMDKQIMDLTHGGSSSIHNSTNDFVDLIKLRQQQQHEQHEEEEEEEEDSSTLNNNGGINNTDHILPSYDFQPIRSLPDSNSKVLFFLTFPPYFSSLTNNSFIH